MKISVIIPCYNAAAFVERAVRSVMAQDYKDYELIAVDDHSTDGTHDVLIRLQQIFPALIVLTSEGKGACAARNSGFAVSTGKYILFLDADDEMLPGKLSSDVQLLTDGNHPSMVAGAYVRRSARGSELIRVQPGNPLVQLFNGELGCTCSNLFNREVFEAAGKWREDLLSSQEAELMLRVLQKEPAVAYNINPNTVVHIEDSMISKRDPVGNLRRYFDVRLKIYDRLASVGKLSPEFLRNAGYMFYGILHRMYGMDSVQSLQMHAMITQRGIKVAAGPGVSPTYKRLCGIFGFRLTEKLFYRNR